jgi:hypothetical protein
MATLDLESVLAEELTHTEMIEIQGGNPWLIPIFAGTVIAAINEIVKDWDNFKGGLLGNCKK